MSGTGGFQTQVVNQPALGVRGDFASSNPWFSFDAGPGGLVADVGGVGIGYFAWANPPTDPNSGPTLVKNSGFGPVDGFVSRHQQGLNTTFLSNAGMSIPEGFMVTLMTGGDFLVDNDGLTTALKGQKAFANLLTGKVSFANAGSVPGGASDSGGACVKTTLTLVGSVSDDILTVTSVSAGTVYPGAVLSSNAVGQITKQLTGTTGGAGTYQLDTGNQSVAAGTTIGGFYGLYTVGSATGTFTTGMVITGTDVPANDVTYYEVTAGAVFVMSQVTAWSSTALVGSSSIETKWIAVSAAAPGNLVKITDHPLG